MIIEVYSRMRRALLVEITLLRMNRFSNWSANMSVSGVAIAESLQILSLWYAYASDVAVQQTG